MAGTALMNRIMLALAKGGATVFRNNTGSGWAGKSFELRPGQTYKAKGGERVVFNARPLKAGLCTGSGDLVGWKTVEVTPDMVGRRLAVFCSFESKDGEGRATAEQKRFAKAVELAGGIGGIVRSEEQAISMLKG